MHYHQFIYNLWRSFPVTLIQSPFFLPRWGRVSNIYTTINVHVFSEMSTFITYLCKITLIFECVIYFTLSIWILISCVLSAVSFVCEGKIYDKVTWTSACRLGNIKYVKKIVIRKKKTKKNKLTTEYLQVNWTMQKVVERICQSIVW